MTLKQISNISYHTKVAPLEFHVPKPQFIPKTIPQHFLFTTLNPTSVKYIVRLQHNSMKHSNSTNSQI